MGEQCECMFIDRNAPFVGVEFRLQGDPETAQLCVLCSRRLTQKLFYDMSYTGQTPKAVIQRYGNVFGQVRALLACAGRTLALTVLPTSRPGSTPPSACSCAPPAWAWT